MFLGSRDTVLEGLRQTGGRLCSYNFADTWVDGRCDCKYGASGKGEQSGCPELRSVYAIVEALTDAEWQILTSRSGHHPGGMELFDPANLASALHRASVALGAAETHIRNGREALEGVAGPDEHEASA
jgi:hypothetical protein